MKTIDVLEKAKKIVEWLYDQELIDNHPTDRNTLELIVQDLLNE